MLLLLFIQSFILLDKPFKRMLLPRSIHLLFFIASHRLPLLIISETIEVILGSDRRFRSGLVIADTETSGGSLALLGRHHE